MDHNEPNYEYNRGWADAMAVRIEAQAKEIAELKAANDRLSELVASVYAKP